MTRARQRLIVALDVPNVEEARTLIDRLGDSVGVYKIGLELLFAGGFSLASELASKGHAASSRHWVAIAPSRGGWSSLTGAGAWGAYV
jgi:orotidine-5'-phosphate decarboxylase